MNAAATNGPNLDLLLDVPLRVRVELGGCAMTVAEVLKLGSGSIVSLDRDVTDPVDVLANDKLVARGEIVAVDDRLGVRITELVQSVS